MFFEKCPVDLY